MRSLDVIDEEIRRQEERLATLRKEREQAGIYKARCDALDAERVEVMERVLHLLDDGWWAAGDPGRLWWHSPQQALERPVLKYERDALETLAQYGAVEHETQIRRSE